ncbi:hypothetical protein JOM56_005601 [Amanita muscaria]
MVKGKARKSDTGQTAEALEPPAIQVDENRPESRLPREESFGRKTKAKVQCFFSHADQTIPESVRRMEQGVQEGSTDNNLMLIGHPLCRDRSTIKIGAIDRKAVQVAIKEAERKVQTMHTIGGTVQKTADLEDQASTALDTLDNISNVLDPLKVFDSVVKGLGDVHPYVKVALSVLSWASQGQVDTRPSVEDRRRL